MVQAANANSIRQMIIDQWIIRQTNFDFIFAMANLTNAHINMYIYIYVCIYIYIYIYIHTCIYITYISYTIYIITFVYIIYMYIYIYIHNYTYVYIYAKHVLYKAQRRRYMTCSMKRSKGPVPVFAPTVEGGGTCHGDDAAPATPHRFDTLDTLETQRIKESLHRPGRYFIYSSCINPKDTLAGNQTWQWKIHLVGDLSIILLLKPQYFKEQPPLYRPSLWLYLYILARLGLLSVTRTIWGRTSWMIPYFSILL